MNILFLTMNRFTDIEMHNIYSDLMKEFIKNGHKPYVVTPREKNLGEETEFTDFGEWALLKVQTGNIGSASLIEKGIATVTIERYFISAMDKFLSKTKFDLILYSTPPITFSSAVKKYKKKNSAFTYLMLKDIFPQNSVDLNMLSKSGVKGLIYKFFRKKEKDLYAISDYIGCMSQANVDYVTLHNPEVSAEKVGLCVNSVDYRATESFSEKTAAMLKKYDIPQGKRIFLYGGNLGKPQGIPFMIDCLRAQKENDKAFFLIIGSGTDYSLIERFIEDEKPRNVKLIELLPKDEYDSLTAGADVGLIFLDHRFTIPNFPSRLLSYMQAGLPVLASTDPNTDIGKVITDGGFGLWCESNDTSAFSDCVNKLCEEDLATMGKNSLEYLKANYTTESTYNAIIKNISEQA